MTSAPLRITSIAFAEVLQRAGVITDLRDVRRIVIVAEAGEALMMHVERFGDERMLDVAALIAGTEPVLEVNEAGYPTGNLIAGTDAK